MKLPKRIAIGALAVATIGVVYAQDTPTSASTTSETAAQLATHPGKGLAGNCFQCHGTNGRGGPFDSIAGDSAAEIFAELKEEQTENEGSGIMGVHANAYTDAELRLIADFFSRS